MHSPEDFMYVNFKPFIVSATIYFVVALAVIFFPSHPELGSIQHFLTVSLFLVLAVFPGLYVYENWRRRRARMDRFIYFYRFRIEVTEKYVEAQVGMAIKFLSFLLFAALISGALDPAIKQLSYL